MCEVWITYLLDSHMETLVGGWMDENGLGCGFKSQSHQHVNGIHNQQTG